MLFDVPAVANFFGLKTLFSFVNMLENFRLLNVIVRINSNNFRCGNYNKYDILILLFVIGVNGNTDENATWCTKWTVAVRMQLEIACILGLRRLCSRKLSAGSACNKLCASSAVFTYCTLVHCLMPVSPPSRSCKLTTIRNHPCDVTVVNAFMTLFLHKTVV